jgi:integrase
MKAAFRDGRIGRNPAQGIRLPRLERREAAYLAPEVVDQIADAMPAAYYLFVSILGALGPRFGEGAGLRRRSVDLLRRRLVISESLAEVVRCGPATSGAAPSQEHFPRHWSR